MTPSLRLVPSRPYQRLSRSDFILKSGSVVMHATEPPTVRGSVTVPNGASRWAGRAERKINAPVIAHPLVVHAAKPRRRDSPPAAVHGAGKVRHVDSGSFGC